MTSPVTCYALTMPDGSLIIWQLKKGADYDRAMRELCMINPTPVTVRQLDPS